MRRVFALSGMAAALVAAYLLNVWFAESLRYAQSNFRMGELLWLHSLLPLVTAAMALGLGWLVLGAGRPDLLVGLAYTIVGLALVAWMPIYMSMSVPWPEWLPALDLLDGMALVLWEAAAIAVIGLAALARWAGSRTQAGPGPDTTDDSAAAGAPS